MNISDPEFHLQTALTLPENEVHLWRLEVEPLAVSEDRWQQLLSTDEQVRAKRFLSVRARQEFVVTRGLLRTVLAAYVEADPKMLVFHHSAREKLRLGPPYADSGVTFNLSHAVGVALLAFSRSRELGVDVERVRRDLDVDSIARRYFSLHEQRDLATFNSEERYETFFRCWTRKEAYIKARGTGLSLPLRHFDVSLKPRDLNALLATRPESSEASHWALQEVSAGEGYVAALCVRDAGWVLKA